MLKIIISFIAGIVFSLIAIFFISNYSYLFSAKDQPFKVTNLAPISLENDNLYIESNTLNSEGESRGIIHAIDIKGKKEKWKFNYVGFFGSGIYCKKDTVILKKSEKLKSINSNTGELLWTADLKKNAITSTLCGNSLININADDMYSYDIENQKVSWEKALNKGWIGNFLCNDNEIYYTSRDGLLHALSLKTGKENWFLQIIENK